MGVVCMDERKHVGEVHELRGVERPDRIQVRICKTWLIEEHENIRNSLDSLNDGGGVDIGNGNGSSMVIVQVVVMVWFGRTGVQQARMWLVCMIICTHVCDE